MGRSPSPSHRRREKERNERKKRRDRRSIERERVRNREKDNGVAGKSRLLRREQGASRNLERDRPIGRRSRSRSRGQTSSSTGKSTRHDPVTEQPKISEVDLEGKSAEEVEMLKTMGFCTFDTTKNKKVDGNDVGEVHVILKRKYRQYMNRKGGFNRPLDFVA